MTTIQNYRDIQLQSTSPRCVSQAADYIRLDAPQSYFKISDTDIVTPSSITVTATPVGIIANNIVTFTIDSGTATFTTSNNTCTIAYSNMTSDSITILAKLTYLGNTYETRYTIAKVFDGRKGVDSVLLDLARDIDVLPTNSSGTNYTLPTESNILRVYNGNTLITSGVVFSGTATKNGLTATIDSSTGVITLSGASWTSDKETFTFTAVYNVVTYTIPYVIVKSKAGSNPQIYTIYTSAPVITKDAPDAATSGTYSSISIQGKKYDGSTTTNYGWITVTANGDVESTTAIDTASTPYTLNTAAGAGKSSYTIKLYNQAAFMGATLLDTQVINVVYKGTNGTNGTSAIQAILSNEAHVFPATTTGTVSNYTGSGTDIRIYEGATELTYDGIGTSNGTWKITTSSINITPGTISDSGVYATIGVHSGVADATDTSSITYNITGKTSTGSAINVTKVQTFSKSKAGVDAVIADLVSESDVIPSASDGTGYTLPSGNYLRLYKGGTVLASGVVYSGTATKNGLTATINASTGAITLSGATWTTTTESFTFTATYNSTAYTATYSITKAKAGTNGTNGTDGGTGPQGPRGSVRLSGTAASAAWSDATANAVFTAKGYTTKVIGDICTLSYSTTWTLTKFWDGSAWATLTELIDGNLLVTGTIAGNKLAANTVTADRIDSRGLSIKDASGNIILAAGTALTTSYISGLGTLATKSSVSATTDVTGLGSFATLSQITAANVSTYIGSAAIGAAYIGDLTATKITSGTFTGLTFQTAISGARVNISAANNRFSIFSASAEVVTMGGGNDLTNKFFTKFSGGSYPNVYFQDSGTLDTVWVHNTYNSGSSNYNSSALYGSSTSNSGVRGTTTYGNGVRGTANGGGATSCGVAGESNQGLGVEGNATSSTTSTNHGVRGTNARGTSGIVGCQNGYNFYADGAATLDYGTFTGAHDILFSHQEQAEIGDIVVDSECLLKSTISNVLCICTKTTQPNQKGTVGVLSLKRGYLRNEYPPAAFDMFNNSVVDDFGNVTSPNATVYEYCCDNYFYHSINALGEGQVNVCGEGGNLEVGDLIVSSSIPGKGMRQADDIVRSYTVAKVREAVTFDSPTQVKMVACIYLCG